MLNAFFTQWRNNPEYIIMMKLTVKNVNGLQMFTDILREFYIMVPIFSHKLPIIFFSLFHRTEKTIVIEPTQRGWDTSKLEKTIVIEPTQRGWRTSKLEKAIVTEPTQRGWRNSKLEKTIVIHYTAHLLHSVPVFGVSLTTLYSVSNF